jgi:NADH-quinone oxidoreductase subunit L
MNLELLCALIPLFPLIGFIINGIGFRRLPNSLVGPIAVGASVASFIVSLILFLGFAGEPMKASYPC